MKPHDSIDHLIQVMIDGGDTAFNIVPKILRNVIEERLWSQRRDKDGELFQSFEAFVTHRLWQGLESSIDDLLAYCRKHPEVQKLIRAEVEPTDTHKEAGAKGGRGNKASSNATGFMGRGSTYQLKRLKRDAPELFRKVVDGEMSANAAAIEAGFRTKTVTVPLDIDRAAQALVRHFGKDTARQLAEAIEKKAI